MATFRRPGCKCPKDTKCKCGAAWSYRIYTNVDPITGKRKQIERSGFRTKKEAELAAYKAELEISTGSYINEKNITFEKFVEEWLEMYKSSGKVKISTIRMRKYESEIIKSKFIKIQLKDITRHTYQKMLNELNFSENTLKGIHATGRMIFKKAVELEIIRNDPTEYAIVPKKVKTVEDLENKIEVVKYLEKDQLSLFLNTAKTKGKEQDYMVFMVLAYTGMRGGELCALKWSDIDFENHTISITKTMYNTYTATKDYVLLTPKTKKSIRLIDIDDVLIKVLLDHQSWQKELKMLHRRTYHDKGFIYTKVSEELAGYPQQLLILNSHMKRLLKLASLNQSLTPHSLRHTHTSLLAQAGVNLEAIMERLGHQNDVVTKSVYLHVTKERKKDAVNKFSELMRGTMGI